MESTVSQDTYMNIAICDDEGYFRKMIIHELQQYASDKHKEFKYYEFHSGEELLESDIRFHLVFMDYIVGDESGVDIINSLRKQNYCANVIFVSSYPSVVFDSLQVQPMRFLMKPVEHDKIYEAMDAYFELCDSQHSVKIYKKAGMYSDEEASEILEQDIFYVRKTKEAHTVITSGSKEMYYPGSITSLQKQLKTPCFFRSHYSTLVNLMYVASFTKNGIVMENGVKLPLRIYKYKEFKDSFYSFIGASKRACLK